MLAIWIIIVVLALGISLYNYFDSRNSSLVSMVFEQRNRRYGAYELRKSYALTMLLTLSGATVLALIAIAPHVELFGGSKAANFTKAPSDSPSDTTLLTLDIPPEDANKTLPPSVAIKADRGNGGQNAADAEEMKKSDGEETEENNQPEQSDNNSKTNPSPSDNSAKQVKKNNKPKTNDREIDDAADNQSLIDAQIKASKERQAEKKRQREQNAQKSNGNNQNSSKGNETQGKVESAADYNLPGRTPFNNDNWYLNYPSYTCYKGGTVIVKIKVDSGGNVISAEAENADTLDECLRRNAEKYAKKARFNASSKSIQEGTLTYRFKAQ